MIDNIMISKSQIDKMMEQNLDNAMNIRVKNTFVKQYHTTKTTTQIHNRGQIPNDKDKSR